MKEMLEKLVKIESECCVTIILNTHRNKPDIQKDAIMLKNLVAEAEERLIDNYDKRRVQSIIERIKELSGKIDHGHNLESLILFMNDDIAEVVKLPVEVEDRVVIGKSFPIRDLIRASKLIQSYYILVLTRDSARLIEAENDKEAGEVGEPFPVENETLYLTTNKALSKAKQKDLMIEEFFNRVDKTLWQTINENPHPVVVCTEERNFSHYMKITDHKEKILSQFNHPILDDKAANLALIAWPLVLKQLQEKNSQRINEVHKALNHGLLVTDTGEIWRAVNEGRGQTLFVQQAYFQPARVNNNLVEVVDGQGAMEMEDGTEDIVEKIIETNFRNGGDVVFLPEEDLRAFQGMALVTRF